MYMWIDMDERNLGIKMDPVRVRPPNITNKSQCGSYVLILDFFHVLT